jgi:transposase-like protein
MGSRGYPPEFRRRVLDPTEAGQKVAELADDLGISDQTIYTWRRQDHIDRGLEAGLSPAEKAALVAARTRIRDLGAELAVHRRATELLKGQADARGGSRPSSPNVVRLPLPAGHGVVERGAPGDDRAGCLDVGPSVDQRASRVSTSSLLAGQCSGVSACGQGKRALTSARARPARRRSPDVGEMARPVGRRLEQGCTSSWPRRSGRGRSSR